jgi:rhomboid protease GluP
VLNVLHATDRLLVRLPDILSPGRLVSFLITTNVMLYVTALLLDPAGVGTRFALFTFLSPSIPVIFKLGSSGSLPLFVDDRWWTIFTASYLHISLAHLLLNMSALRSLGNFCLPIFGASRMFIVYFFGGAISMLGSSLAGIPLTLGASGAICALVGCVAYDDWQSHKGNIRRRITSVAMWVGLILVTGLLFPGVNNWAHGIGFAVGFVLAVFLRPATTIHVDASFFRVSSALCMLLTIATLMYGLLS